ncbi:hypothetical protein CKM354_001168300 [Cercospora kikuchii]|uniref:Uncharacterized protein n=1 Tax=Cercospora kikuchii TaxID=84275 RepID=A0A9P3FIJ1_9PEZI|nr:uncharacterized protein CKM354_001168300 [Cercospora kikuchii]GIZ48631.1 hypothetical protein CKM354_001168300 [Cercospora kikuchii]
MPVVPMHQNLVGPYIDPEERLADLRWALGSVPLPWRTNCCPSCWLSSTTLKRPDMATIMPPFERTSHKWRRTFWILE